MQVCSPVFPLRIDVDAPLPLDLAHPLLRATQHALDAINDFPAHNLRLALAPAPVISNASQQVVADYDNNSDGTSALTVRLIPVETGTTPRSHLQPYSSTLDVYYASSQLPSDTSTSSPLATFIAQELQKIYEGEQAQLSYVISNAGRGGSLQTKPLSSETLGQLHRQSARAFKYAPTYHLTFSLFTPTSAPSAWDIEAALRQYMNPMLESFSSISNFTIDTQVQLYANFSPSIRQPVYEEEAKAWTLFKDDIGGFVNAAEWPLSPSIGKGPTINFALYIPDQAQSPLLIQESKESSWLIPQWGGIMILNLPSAESTPAALSKEDLVPAMQTFSNQLSSLLGLPQQPASLPLRIDTLTRVRTTSLIYSASSTLGALAQVYRNLPNIPVPDSVARSVDLSLAHLQQACDALRDGRFQDALENARIADGQSESAFFERSMVGQVYFPDEHKVAVYLPLLGPIAVPLIMGALKEIKAFVSSLKKK